MIMKNCKIPEIYSVSIKLQVIKYAWLRWFHGFLEVISSICTDTKAIYCTLLYKDNVKYIILQKCTLNKVI